MGPVIPFIPTILSGAGMLFGRNKGGPNKAAKQNTAAQTGAAQQAGQQADQMAAYGNPLLQQSSNYYKRILTGDKAAMASALAPEVNAVNETFQGAARGIDRSGAQGAIRAVQQAQLSRERAGRVSSLFPAARRDAAERTAEAGRFAIGAGQTARGQQGSLYESLLNGERQDREIGLREQGSFGESIGGLLAQVMQGQGTKRQPSGGGSNPVSATGVFDGGGLTNPGVIVR